MPDQGWVLLLRGINVGSRNRVSMADLRRVLDDSGCGAVSTYIQSGNAVFRKKAKDRAALAEQLERAIEGELGVAPAVVLRTFDEIGKVVRSHPFGPDTSKSHVAFLAKKPPAAEVRRVLEADVAPDRIEVSGTEVFLHYPNGISGSRVKPALLDRLGVATMRNWRTVTRLAEMANAADAP